MNKTVLVNLTWTPEAEGGRRHVFPVGMRYYPIAVVEGSENLGSLWSSSVTNTQVLGRETVAELSYLVDEAPHQLLQPGKSVLLYEGPRIVAEGRIEKHLV